VQPLEAVEDQVQAELELRPVVVAGRSACSTASSATCGYRAAGIRTNTACATSAASAAVRNGRPFSGRVKPA
jgi:hypothetical protein